MVSLEEEERVQEVLGKRHQKAREIFHAVEIGE